MRNLNFKKYLLIIAALILTLIKNTYSQTIIPTGNVYGTWTKANSPFNITGPITIPKDSTLIIDPGVEIIFQGHHKFNVQGRLLAIGTVQDSIHFTAENTSSGWHGIRFINTPESNDTSKIIYCSFKYGNANTGVNNSWDRCGGAIFIRGYNKILIANSLFCSNMNNGDIASATGGAAIYAAYASPMITNSTFLNNRGTTDCSILFWYSNGIISNNIFSNNSGPHGPIFCAYYSPTVSGNIISHNVTTRAGGGIFTMTSNTMITNNIIYNNSCFGGEGEAGGIKSWINDKSIIINNTIAYNSAAHGGGVACNSNSDPIYINNIIWGNSSQDGAQVNLLDRESDPHFLYCDIQGRKEEFRGPGSGSNYTGYYESNIDLNPLFSDSSSGNFSLTDPSHCIGAGFDSVEVDGEWYRSPKFCFWGTPRPSPAGSRPDIGACESSLGSIVGVDQESITPIEFTLYQNYPNPFNPNTTIKYSISSNVNSEMSNVKLSVYNILGKEVAVLVNQNQKPDYYEVEWLSGDKPSGVYFYKLIAGDYTEVKKMLLLK